MAFPTNSLQRAYQKAQTEAERLAQFSAQVRTMMATQNVSANQILQVQTIFKSSIEALQTAATTPGIAQYAKDQQDDQTFDIVAEFQAMLAAAAAVRDNVESTLPQDANGYLGLTRFDVSHSLETRAFTPAQTAALQSLLAAFEATVG